MSDETETPTGEELGVAGGACEVCQYPLIMCECLPPPPVLGFMEMAPARYHNDPCETISLSSSVGHLMVDRCPQAAWSAHPRGGGKPRKSTPALSDGSHVHGEVLGKGGPVIEVVNLLTKTGKPIKDFRTKAAQEKVIEIERRGHVALLPAQAARYERLGAKVTESLAGHGLNFQDAGSVREVAMFWEETSTGGIKVQCRGLLDYWHLARASYVDLKTARSAHPKALSRSVQTYGYDIQNAAYTSGLEKNYPDLVGRIDYLWAFCELTDPFLSTPARPSEAMKELGRLKWQQAIDMWADCLMSDRWPGYVEGTAILEPAPWAFEDFTDEV